MLVEIVSDLEKHVAPEDRPEIWVDGGFRRGSDIFKAIALGAKAVGIGRPSLYGLACYGEEGVEKGMLLCSFGRLFLKK